MYILETIQELNNKFADKISGLTLEELNAIPCHFNNNIIWNFGHVVTTSYSLSYIRTGVDSNYHIPFFENYRNGSKPQGTIGKEEIEALKILASDFNKTLSKDISKGVFNKISPFSTLTYGVQMDTIDEVLMTIFGHNSLHYGITNSMMKIIK